METAELKERYLAPLQEELTKLKNELESLKQGKPDYDFFNAVLMETSESCQSIIC